MVIYEPLVADDFEWVNACDDRDYEVFLALDGQPRKSTWVPIMVRRVPADEHHEFKPSDFPWLGSDALVMRPAAVVALRDMIDAHGALLPLLTDDGVELLIFNLRTLDALDEAHSSVTRFPGTERIMRIKKVAFFASIIQGVDIFRLPQRASSTYVSERFVERVETSGLRGLTFKKVWSE